LKTNGWERIVSSLIAILGATEPAVTQGQLTEVADMVMDGIRTGGFLGIAVLVLVMGHATYLEWKLSRLEKRVMRLEWEAGKQEPSPDKTQYQSS
jgi:hypothetical protein